MILLVLFKVRHVILEWQSGKWERAAYTLWDSHHFLPYRHYCASEEGIATVARLLVGW